MKIKEKHIQIILVIAVIVMTILRFLLNEKGRVSPDSIRFIRFAHVFPVIDNTITPTGYPLAIKLITFFGSDEFWSSKILGILCLSGIIVFAKWKNFFLREVLMTCCLFSFVSVFAATLSEALMLLFIFILLFICRNITEKKYGFKTSVIYLSLILIVLYNIRYTALFFMIGTGFFRYNELEKIIWKSHDCIVAYFRSFCDSISDFLYQLF
ncbi:hypothetical protein ASG01_13995 [Chryseobacterium sp. Leaf180]|nr:hypothetical protein ASG01_13995 [Chryseobacterium sp. Leaf180]